MIRRSSRITKTLSISIELFSAFLARNRSGNFFQLDQCAAHVIGTEKDHGLVVGTDAGFAVTEKRHPVCDQVLYCFFDATSRLIQFWMVTPVSILISSVWRMHL